MAGKTPSKAKRDRAKRQWADYEDGELNIGKSDKKVKSKAQAQAIILNTLGIEKSKRKKKK